MGSKTRDRIPNVGQRLAEGLVLSTFFLVLAHWHRSNLSTCDSDVQAQPEETHCVACPGMDKRSED